MDVQDLIAELIAAQPERKRADMQSLHRRIVEMSPGARLSFFSGRNAEGKVVANPSIGYGTLARQGTKGQANEGYLLGLSATGGGISLYLMGLADRTYLPRTYGTRLGKAKVTGYCISFRSLRDVDGPLLEAAIAEHLNGQTARA